MTPEFTPFDHRPDPVLGAALRAALTADGNAAFVAGVLARLHDRPQEYWEVLASWARAGITAVAAAALLGGLLIGTWTAPASLDDVLAAGAGSSARAMVSADHPPDPTVVLASAEVP